MKFGALLREQLRNFSLEEAEALSCSIHDAEANGYTVTKTEDRLWERLTARILRFYAPER